jgi:hypothetical protein
MTETKDSKEKCAHTPCKCEAAKDSKYCGAYCEGREDTTEILCSCGHPACTG